MPLYQKAEEPGLVNNLNDQTLSQSALGITNYLFISPPTQTDTIFTSSPSKTIPSPIQSLYQAKVQDLSLEDMLFYLAVRSGCTSLRPNDLLTKRYVVPLPSA